LVDDAGPVPLHGVGVGYDSHGGKRASQGGSQLRRRRGRRRAPHRDRASGGISGDCGWWPRVDNGPRVMNGTRVPRGGADHHRGRRDQRRGNQDNPTAGRRCAPAAPKPGRTRRDDIDSAIVGRAHPADDRRAADAVPLQTRCGALSRLG
jgi:hypothetical protein